MLDVGFDGRDVPGDKAVVVSQVSRHGQIHQDLEVSEGVFNGRAGQSELHPGGDCLGCDGGLCFGIFNMLGFMLAIYLAFHVNNVGLVNIFPLAVGILFLYSAFLKRKTIWGNLVVAVFSAAVPGLVWFAERGGFSELSQKNALVAQNISLILIAYLLFAFFSTLMREIIKDIEDQEGDSSLHYATVPLQWGEKRAKQLALFFGLCLFVLIVVLLPLFLRTDHAISPYILLGLILIPLMVVLYLLFKAKKREEYSRLSFLTKLLMLSGILLLFFI